jgi:hypothetical protein
MVSVKWLALVGETLLVLFVGMSVFWQVYWQPPDRVDFLLHRSEYEGIVRSVKEQGIPPGTQEQKIQVSGRTTWVRCTDDGHYTIAIETVDNGHFGSAGYVFADVPPARLPDPYNDLDVPGGLPQFETQLSAHWWIVHNNLN